MRITLDKYPEGKVVVDEAKAEIRVANDDTLVIYMPDADLALRLTETEAIKLGKAAIGLGSRLAGKRHALEQFEMQLGESHADEAL
jgi:hypothetical protein